MEKPEAEKCTHVLLMEPHAGLEAVYAAAGIPVEIVDCTVKAEALTEVAEPAALDKPNPRLGLLGRLFR